MGVLQNFIKEVKAFSRTNWWVYIIYFILLGIILKVEQEKLPSVLMITSLHFVADIFIMMMFTAYSNNQKKQGTYYQVMSMLIFMSLKIYTGIVDHTWHYLAADPIYIFAAVKNYRIDVKKSDLKFVNYKTMSVLGIFIILFLMVVSTRPSSSLTITPSEWVQTTGIFLFAIALSTTGNEHLRSELAIMALVAMVAGSAWETGSLLVNHKIVGLALSYFLLPLTVLVFYIRNWSTTLHSKKKPDSIDLPLPTEQ